MLYDASGNVIHNEDGATPSQAPNPYIEAAKQAWHDLQYLREVYELFLTAVQVGASKDYQYNDQAAYDVAGKPVWNMKDTFRAWVADVEIQLECRLQELKEKYAAHRPTDKNLLRVAESGDFQSDNPYVLKTLASDDYEVLDFMIRKSQEAIKKYTSGKITMDQIRRYVVESQ